MLKALRILFSTIALILATYSFFSESDQLPLYIQIFLSLTCLTWGISEIKEQRKSMGILFICVAIFISFVAFVKMFR
ncbi:YczI family protein [Bacillus cytotoxicus]|uniref:YczI family protein n=1 Tax=Bacillus cytotoxicus TaxID=580165 RepID=A0ACC6A0Z6_9BACI|nr:YczI family protein [Bacillus cytotoxicus]